MTIPTVPKKKLVIAVTTQRAIGAIDTARALIATSSDAVSAMAEELAAAQAEVADQAERADAAEKYSSTLEEQVTETAKLLTQERIKTAELEKALAAQGPPVTNT